MASGEALKRIVREKYGEVARRAADAEGCGCSCGCGTDGAETVRTAEEYGHLEGYVKEADLGLGCGLPTEFAKIRPGDTVVDLGSGAGNDAFIARAIVGGSGRVIGVDMTEAMIAKARTNAATLGYANVEFRLGDIEELPVDDASVDVVVSNCVMNLVPDKQKAYGETYRILKPGGHFSISDIVLRGELPPAVREAASLYAGCIGGAEQIDDYLAEIDGAGFVNVTIQKERRVDIPDDVIVREAGPAALQAFRKADVGVFSVTVYADKPGVAKAEGRK
jgi:arsenite methyltransferase